jgi:hypothetical protein
MKGAGLDRPRSTAAVVRKALWITVGVTVILLVVFGSLSAANFTSIVQAKASAYIVPQFTVTFAGLGSDGRLTPDGSVTVRLAAGVENPSSRTLHIYLVAYSGWLRDGPAEAGLNETRRIGDDLMIGTEGQRWFFRVFGQSAELTLDPIPARGNRTFTFDFTISAATDAARFAAVRNITDFAVAQGGEATSVSWNQFLYIVLTIDGVPEATSPSAPAYLRDIRRIEREIGVNIAS